MDACDTLHVMLFLRSTERNKVGMDVEREREKKVKLGGIHQN
jgi:hypothetical protein